LGKKGIPIEEMDKLFGAPHSEAVDLRKEKDSEKNPEILHVDKTTTGNC